MVQKKAKSASGKNLKTVSLIYVRDVDGKQNQMLRQLEVITKKNSNASNIMWAGFKVLELLDDNKKLRSENKRLERDNAMKDSKYKQIKDGISRVILSQNEAEAKLIRSRKSFVSELKRMGNKIPKAGKRSISSLYDED